MKREPKTKVGLDRLSPYSMWCLFAELAKGSRTSEICRRFHIRKEDIEKVKREPGYKENIHKCRDRIMTALTDEFMTQVKPAAQELERLTHDDNPQIRLAACSKIIDSFIRYKDLAWKQTTVKALRETKHESQQSVLDSLPLDQLQALLQQGAVIKQLDLSQVDAEKLKLTLRQISNQDHQFPPQAPKTIDVE